MSEGCFIIFRCSLSVFLSKELHGYSDKHFQEFRYLSLFVKVLLSEVFKLSVCLSKMLKCLLSEVFNCQFVKDVEVFLQAPCVLFVRGFYGLGIGRFLHVCFSEVLLSKGFFRSCFLVFVGLLFVSESFFRFCMFVRVWVSEHCFRFF